MYSHVMLTATTQWHNFCIILAIGCLYSQPPLCDSTWNQYSRHSYPTRQAMQTTFSAKNWIISAQTFSIPAGWEPDRVLGDGNCLFWALSRALTGVEDHHIALRKTIAEFEASNTTVFQPLHSAINQTPAIPFSDHLRNIRKLSVWGTNLEIIAAVSLFQLDIYLATETYHLRVPTWLLTLPNLCLLSPKERAQRSPKWQSQWLVTCCQLTLRQH